jgi:hypothetical protein
MTGTAANPVRGDSVLRPQQQSGTIPAGIRAHKSDLSAFPCKAQWRLIGRHKASRRYKLHDSDGRSGRIAALSAACGTRTAARQTPCTASRYNRQNHATYTCATPKATLAYRCGGSTR